MSIEIDNPTTPQGISDAIGNLIEQMMLAHRMGDHAKFMMVYEKASELSFELTIKLGEDE